MNVAYFMFQQTMPFTIPLMIMALGGMFSERNGVVNITLEGIMTTGAFTGILFLNMARGRMSEQMQLLLAIPISTTMEAVFASFHAYASIDMRANQTISGTALNMFVLASVIFAARVIQGVQQIQFNNASRIESVPLLDSISFFRPLLFQNTYITTYPDVTILILSTLMLYRTRFSLRLCSCGEHPQATDAAGISVYRMQHTGVLISEILGGLRGPMFMVSTSTNFDADVAGYGFLALTILILGQWKPMKIMWASLFFGLVKVMAAACSNVPFLAATRIPNYVYRMIPYVTTSIVLMFISGNSQAPKTSGIPYDKGQR